MSAVRMRKDESAAQMSTGLDANV